MTHEIRDLAAAGARDFSGQIAELRQALDAQSAVYRARIELVAEVMNEVAGQLEDATAC